MAFLTLLNSTITSRLSNLDPICLRSEHMKQNKMGSLCKTTRNSLGSCRNCRPLGGSASRQGLRRDVLHSDFQSVGMPRAYSSLLSHPTLDKNHGVLAWYQLLNKWVTWSPRWSTLGHPGLPQWIRGGAKRYQIPASGDSGYTDYGDEANLGKDLSSGRRFL